MPTTTEKIKTALGLKLEWEYNTQGPYQMFDSGGCEVEVGEFLYGLVKAVKPQRILETGLYSAITTMFMADAVRDNGFGHIDTVEWERQHIERSKERLSKMDLLQFVTVYNESSLDFQPSGEYDLVLLDTEPQLRLSELVKFWSHIKPGGIIIIHDLNELLGNRQSPWEDFVEKIGDKIKDNELQIIHLPTPRGITLMQKFSPTMAHFKLRMGQI